MAYRNMVTRLTESPFRRPFGRKPVSEFAPRPGIGGRAIRFILD